MIRTTAGQLLVDTVLPADLRRPGRVLDKKGVEQLMQEVADKHPEKYEQILHDLTKIGYRVSYDTGANSFGIEAMKSPPVAIAMQQKLRAEIDAVHNNQNLSEEERHKKVVSILESAGDKYADDIFKETLAQDNPLARQVNSGARGNKGSLRSLLGGDLMFADHRGNNIPVPILHSYAQGLSPAEYLAGAFGTRSSIIATKFSTADAGFACLAAGTLVRMADGTTKAIEILKSEEIVLGADKEGNTFPVKITAIFDNGLRHVQKFMFGETVQIEATMDHKVLVASNWGKSNQTTDVKQLGLVTYEFDLVAIDEHGKPEAVHACDSPVPLGYLPTYDIEVDHPDHLFVLANGAIVSNSKQLMQASHRLVVTDLDDDKQPEHVRGFPTDISDPDNEGALLAQPLHGYPRNTILTPKVLADLRDKGTKHFLVRSPTVGGPTSGGVYARDVGIRERGTLPPKGDFVGLAAASAAGEPLSQAQLCLDSKTTFVMMHDGTTRRIDKVVIGDIVMGADKRGRYFPVSVVAVHDNGMKHVHRFRFDGPDIFIDATMDHKVLTDHGIVIPIGSLVDSTINGYTLLSYKSRGERHTIDLEVNHEDHLFVLSNGMIVSNSAKHSGGVAGGAKGVSGFAAINAHMQVPKTFPGGATHARLDGRVSDITKAPQGGHFVYLGNERHHIPQGLDPTVKVGDEVEAGDVLSEGTPNPAEIVQHKGIGEGRRYFVGAFQKAFASAGIRLHRRNAELVARGLIDHVRMTDEHGRHVPGDIISYSRLEPEWQPRDGYVIVDPKRAMGHYIEKPVLHYSIGTRVTPSVVKSLKDHGINNLAVHQDPPPFEPEMVRGMESVSKDADWMTRMMGSYLQRGLLQGVHRADVSDEEGTSYVPALAHAQDFGRKGLAKGFTPPAITPRGPKSILDGLL